MIFVLREVVFRVSVSEELFLGFRSQKVCLSGFGFAAYSGKWERLREIAVILHFRPFEKASLS